MNRRTVGLHRPHQGEARIGEPQIQPPSPREEAQDPGAVLPALGVATQGFPEAVGPVGGLGIQAEPRKEFGEGAVTHGLQQERLVRSSHVWEG